MLTQCLFLVFQEANTSGVSSQRFTSGSARSKNSTPSTPHEMMSGKRESSPLLRQRSESPVIIHSPIEIPTSDAQNGGNGTPRSPRRLGFIRHGIEQIATWSRSKTAKQKRRQNVTSLVGNRSSFIAAGHDYEVVSLTNPHWCDHCGDFIWGLFTTAVRCKRERHTISFVHGVLSSSTACETQRHRAHSCMHNRRSLFGVSLVA